MKNINDYYLTLKEIHHWFKKLQDKYNFTLDDVPKDGQEYKEIYRKLNEAGQYNEPLSFLYARCAYIKMNVNTKLNNRDLISYKISSTEYIEKYNIEEMIENLINSGNINDYEKYITRYIVEYLEKELNEEFLIECRDCDWDDDDGSDYGFIAVVYNNKFGNINIRYDNTLYNGLEFHIKQVVHNDDWSEYKCQDLYSKTRNSEIGNIHKFADLVKEFK